MLTKEAMTSEVFIGFLGRLIQGADHPFFLILNGHSVHKSKKVKEYVTSLGGNWCFFLSGYSPELNPDEHIWGYVEHHVVGRKVITGPDQFYALVVGGRSQKNSEAPYAYSKHFPEQ